MLYESFEILGTEMPIFSSKTEAHVTYEEIIHLDENPLNYEMDGYIPVFSGNKTLFKAVFRKRG